MEALVKAITCLWNEDGGRKFIVRVSPDHAVISIPLITPGSLGKGAIERCVCKSVRSESLRFTLLRVTAPPWRKR
jgi:hypothetical protein